MTTTPADAMTEFARVYLEGKCLSLADVNEALTTMIVGELAAHDATYLAELPESSRIMLNGARRLAERLGISPEEPDSYWS